MEKEVLSSLARKLGIQSESLLRKAEEYMCLVDVRAGSSSLAVLRPSGASKAAMCLELAATACGENLNRTDAVRVSGMNKKLYINALRAIESLLDLQPNTSIPDLAVQFGVSQARPLAIKIIQTYEAEHKTEGTVCYSQALFNGAALMTACRRLKLKFDKKKLVDLAGVKKTTFDRLVAVLDKTAEKILADERKPVKGKRTKNFIEELQRLPDEDTCSRTKTAKVEDKEDDFHVWKQQILEKAYAALGKTYKPER